MMIPKLLTEQEVADLLQVHVATVARWRKGEKIGYLRVGSRIKYTEQQAVDFLESQRVDPCQDREKTDQDKSETTGSRNARTARSGVAPGSTRTPDRHAANRLAQLTFGKLNSD